ncbi:MAG: hypothetical protein HY744_24730 [Deltaproteobacteria bacterium]|nr:hypothetical protein [Deltaproteobacteria bacterium]
MKTPTRCFPVSLLALATAAASSACSAPEQAAAASTTTTASDQPEAGADAALDAEVAPDAGKVWPPCDCEQSGYWVELEGDGEPQKLTYPYEPEYPGNCTPLQPYLCTFLGLDLVRYDMIFASASPSTTTSCLLLDERVSALPPYSNASIGRYLDRLGNTWTLSDVYVDIPDYPDGQGANIATGSFAATAARGNDEKLLLHGTLRVCWVCAFVYPK